MDPNQQPVPESNYVPVPPEPYVRPQQQQYTQPTAQPDPVVESVYASQPVTVQPTLEQAYEAAPVSVPTPAQPFGPQLVQLPQQPPAPAPGFGSGPQPGFGATEGVPAPFSPKKSPKKLIIIISAAVAGIVALSAVAWLAYTLISSNIALKEYSNDVYSLMVPESYTQDISGTDANFVEPKATSDTESQIQVTSFASDAADQKVYVEAIDKSLTAEALSADAGDNNKLANVKIDKDDVNGNPSRVVTADIQNSDSKKIGTFRYFITFGEKRIYLVLVVAHESDPGIAANAAKITDSFKIK